MSKQLIAKEKKLLLKNLSKLLEILGEESPSLQSRIKTLQEKIKTLRFQVAIVGEFSTGKSSFLNALLGDEILPTALEECTAVITRIKHTKADMTSAKVLYKKGNQESVAINQLGNVLTFEAKQKNAFEEVCIEISKNDFLLEDVDFIDTPGVNDPTKTGDLITLHWLPQSDAIIFLTHCERAFKESELDFLKNHVSSKDSSRFIFVINAADLIEDEQDHTLLKERHAKLLHSKYPTAPLHFVSSHQALDGLEEEDEEEYIASGIPSIRQDIHSLILKEKGRSQIEQIKQMSKILHNEVQKYLETNLRTIQVEDELKNKIISRKRQSIQKAKQEQQMLHQTLNQELSLIRSSLFDSIDKNTSHLANSLNLISGDAKIVKKQAQKETQKEAKKLSSSIQDKLRTDINRLQNTLSHRIHRLLGEIDTDFSASSIPAVQQIDWASFVQVNTTVEEIEKEKLVHSPSNNDSGALFGMGAGAMLGLVLVGGPLAFIAGAAMGAAVMEDNSTGRSVVQTIKEKISKSKANGEYTSQALQKQFRNSVQQATSQIQQTMAIEIDAVIQTKLNEVENQIIQLDRQERGRIADSAEKSTLERKLTQLQQLQY